MLTYILAGGIILITYLIYRFWLKPIKLMQHYGNLFRKQGYRVHILPYKVHTAPVYERLFQSLGQYGDSFYYHKHTYFNYDMIISNVLSTPQIFFMNFDLIKEVVSADKIWILPKVPLGFSALKVQLEGGIIFTEKKEWKNRRKILSKIFNFDFITSNIKMMTRASDMIFQEFENHHQKQDEKKKSGQFEMELYQMLTRFSSTVIMVGFFGFDILKEKFKGKSLAQAILNFQQKTIQHSQDPLVLALGQKFLKKGLRKKDRECLQEHKQISEVIHKHINSIKEQIDKDGDNVNKQGIVSSLLLERKKAENESIFDISDESIIGQVNSFMVAGSQTTSNFLTMMILYVFQKPEVESRLRKQIDSVIKSDEDITVDNFKKLTYLDCIIYETSRMFSSATGLFERIAEEDTSIGGVPIKKGTSIAISWVPFLYNPETFDKPFEFIPQRWENENKEQIQLVTMVFSGGPRSCLGKNLALTEMRVMMIKFMKRYSKVVEVFKGERKFEQMLTLHLLQSKVIITKNETK